MSDLLHDLPVVKNEDIGDTVFFLPPIHPVVYAPLGGFTSLESYWLAVREAIREAYIQAEKQGRVGAIKNVKAGIDEA